MKKAFIFALLIIALSSCQKKNLDTVPSYLTASSWEWKLTEVGGFIGIIQPQEDRTLSLSFCDDHTMSITLNDETMPAIQVPFQIRLSDDSELGDYILFLSKKDREQVKETLGNMYEIVMLEGYLGLNDTPNDGTTLFIKDTQTTEVGIEGGPNFRKKSYFGVKND